MTDLLSRPIIRVEPEASEPTRPLALSSAIAASIAAAIGLIVCLAVAVAVWFTADAGSFADAIRVGVLGWVVMSGGGLQLPTATMTVIPLGFVLAEGWLLYRGGRWAGQNSRVRPGVSLWSGVAAITAVYAAIGLLAYAVTNTAGAHASPLRSVLSTAATALVFGGIGIVRGAGQTEAVIGWLPDEARAIAAGAVAGALVLLGASALLYCASVVTHFSRSISLAESLHAGLLGGAVVALISAAAVPNAILCAGAFAVGPGFAVGTGTSVTPDRVDLGALPDIPLLAALPSHTGAWWQLALMALPIVAGAVAGAVAIRRASVDGLLNALLHGGVAGATAGVAFGAVTWLATGSAGPGRMSHIGPDVVPTMVMAAGGCLLGGAIAAASYRWLAAGWRARTSR